MSSHIWLLEPCSRGVEVFAISRSYETSESPNFFDVPSDLSFSQNLNRLLKNESQTNSSLKMTVMPTVALQGLRKLEWRQQQVVRIDNFRYHCKQRRSSRLDCIFRRKFRFFVGNEKSGAFCNYVRIFNLADLTRSVYENLLRLATRCWRFIYFRKPSLARNGFSKPDFS